MISGVLAGFASAQDLGSSWAVKGATLIDGTGASAVADAVILGRGERITCVGSVRSCPIADDAAIVDATGKWVMPGLIDTHVHLNWAKRGDDARRAQLTRLAFGITTTREAGTPQNLDENLAARSRANSPAAPEPHLVVSALVSAENLQRYGGGDVAGLVHRLAALGVDAIKIKQEHNADELRAIVGAAHAAGLPVFGHTWYSDRSHLEAALAAGIDGLSHMDTFAAFGQRADAERPPAPDGLEFWLWTKELWNYRDDARLEAAIDTIVEHEVWVEPTLVTEIHYTFPYPLSDDLAYLGDMPPLDSLIRPWLPFGSWGWRASRERRQRLAVVYQHICEFVRRFRARGGMVVTGTDNAQPGPALLDEVGLLTNCGLSPMAALQAATQRAAAALKRQEIGTAEAGKLADLVILEGDPLSNPANLKRIWRVVKGGHLYNPTVLLGPTRDAYRSQMRRTFVRRALGSVAVLLTIGATLVAGRLWRRRSS